MMKRVEMKRNRKSNPGGGGCMHIGMHVSEDSNKLQVGEIEADMDLETGAG